MGTWEQIYNSDFKVVEFDHLKAEAGLHTFVLSASEWIDKTNAIGLFVNMIGIGERAGSGIPDIYQVWENEGWPMPVVEESYNPDRTRLSLEFSKKQAIKTSDKNKLRKTQEKEELIREYLRQNGLSKTSEIAEYIELSPARTRALLSDMTDVVVEGANKNRKYRLATED